MSRLKYYNENTKKWEYADSQYSVGSGSNTFVATYGETTNAEIYAAYKAGKTLFVRQGSAVWCSNSAVLPLTARFGGTINGNFVQVNCINDEWTITRIKMTESITEESTHEEHPSAKAVYDYVSEHSGDDVFWVNASYDPMTNRTTCKQTPEEIYQAATGKSVICELNNDGVKIRMVPVVILPYTSIFYTYAPYGTECWLATLEIRDEAVQYTEIGLVTEENLVEAVATIMTQAGVKTESEINEMIDTKLEGFTPDSGGNADYVSVEPAKKDVPRIFFGSPLQATKDEVVTTFSYRSETLSFDCYAGIKAQGNSTMNWPKKNQTVKLYKDAACEEKLKINFKGWGTQNKFVIKAYWMDPTHVRDIVSVRLEVDCMKTRDNFNELPELLRTSPHLGACDGFPVLVYADGVYQGRYMMNIPKDKWMANMDDDLDEHCILCSEDYNSSCFRTTANINGNDWTDEIHDTVPASIKTRWNEVISFVKNSTDEEFVANLDNYIDVSSLVDRHIIGLLSCDYDGYGKNQLYLTYDGKKWYAGCYDKDGTWGSYWNGSKILPYNYGRDQYEDMISGRPGNLLFIRFEQLFWERLQDRWNELKVGPLSVVNIISRFRDLYDITPNHLIAEDYASTTANGAYTGMPQKTTNTIQQIQNFVPKRHAWMEEYIANLTPDVPLYCEGISLDKTTLTFTSDGTQTVTATVIPDGCIDPVVWVSTDPSVAIISVSGNVCSVSSIANGSTTITATCGEYSATCSVSVSGIAEPVPCTGITLDKTSLSFDGEGTQSLVATVTPSNTTDVVVWSSSDDSIARVENGVVTAVKTGSAVITATCGSQSAICSVSVVDVKTYLYQNYSPNGEKFSKTLNIDLETQFVEASIDLTGQTANGNILGVGQNIESWRDSNSYQILYTTTTGNLEVYAITGSARPYGSCCMIKLDTNNVLIRIDRHGVVVNGYRLTKADYTDNAGLCDGTGDMYEAFAEYVKTLSEVQIGSMEGSQRSYATYNYIKVDSIVECTDVHLDADMLTFDGVGSKTLVATNIPADTNEVITWSSSDTSVLTVENGVVTAVGNGSAIITYTCGSQTASCEVEVTGIEYPVLYSMPEETTFDGTNYIDTEVQLFAEDKPFTLLVDWEGIDTAQSSNTVLHCMHEASPYSGVQVMYQSSGRFKMEINQTKSLTIQALANDGLSTALSVNVRVAFVKDKNGMMTIYRRYNGEGDIFEDSAQGTYTQIEQNLLLGCYQDINGVKGRYVKGTMHECKVYDGTISNPDLNDWLLGLAISVPCTGITLDKSELSFDGEGTQTLMATVTPTDTTDRIIWSSDNPSVATVEDGVVTAIYNGSATITATCGSQAANCEISVSGVEAALLYSLPQETVFDGTNYIDTEVKLFDAPKDFTILLTVDLTKLNTTEYATVFHAKEEGVAKSGVHMMMGAGALYNIGGYEGTDAREYSWNYVTGLSYHVKKIAISVMQGVVTDVRYASLNGITKATLPTAHAFQATSNNLLLGAYQDKNGTIGRYWNGIIHDFKVYDGVLADDVIDNYLVVQAPDDSVARFQSIDGTATTINGGTMTIENGNHLIWDKTITSACFANITNIFTNTQAYVANKNHLTNKPEIFKLHSGDIIRTVVTAGDANTNTAEMTLFGVSANATDTLVDLWGSNTAVNGEQTVTCTKDGAIGAVGLYVAKTSACIVDVTVEMYVNGVRYI